ncbi:MAG: hypothetical protein ACQKBV_12270 [Puniceicoccales bacterium]
MDASRRSSSRDLSRQQDTAEGESAEPTHTCVQMLHVSEIDLHNGFLEAMRQVGPMMLFGRNRHVIAGLVSELPTLSPFGDGLIGSNPELSLHLDLPGFHRGRVIHEQDLSGGMFVGMECYDEHNNALFRAALTPGSAGCAFQHMVHHHHRRCVPLDEAKQWRRLADLTSIPAANHRPIDPSFCDADPWSRPVDAAESMVKIEAGFAGNIHLAPAVLEEAIEEERELSLTVSGGFGRMHFPFGPERLETAQRGWICAGGNGAMIRFDPNAIASYWVGSYEELGTRFSYLEAVDVYGDLIFRLASPNRDAHRYWRALASGMEPRAVG